MPGQLNPILAICIISPLISCVEEQDFDMDRVDRIEYRFTDSSVPPEYHRSYTISVTNGLIEIVVDSYGDVLNKTSFSSNAETFKKIKEGFKENDISAGKNKEDDGCSGGTTDKFSCFIGEKEVFNAWQYNCASENGGTLRGKVEEYVQDFKDLIPDLSNELE
jgi:hypothetical protein